MIHNGQRDHLGGPPFRRCVHTERQEPRPLPNRGIRGRPGDNRAVLLGR